MNKLKIYSTKRPLGIRTLTAFLCTVFVFTSVPLYANAVGTADDGSAYASGADYEREIYYSQLIEKGFPADYADKLTELKLAHPTWSFEPLFISELNPAYTFDYIIKKETEDPQTNLVYPSNEYRDFFDKASGAVYDSGWYSASDDAVRYFMDARNFLNESDIFQFEDLSYYDRDYSNGVKKIVDGTFMSGLVLENGSSFSDYVLSVGKRLSVSPVHIAARIRQEQGASGNVGTVSGVCGDVLYDYYKKGTYIASDGTLINAPSSGYSKSELLSYNGYYNFLNIGATGTGLFNVYLSAMKRAKTGTPQMAAEWGNDTSWNKMYKAIYGGVYTLKDTYIDDYQNTLYLQKFNVDPRSSRNFWGQYMQNVGAALSEGRSAYRSYKEAGILESEFVFSIPVYSGMPKTPCPDPSGGESDYSAEELFSYVIRTDHPYTANTQGRESRGRIQVNADGQIRIQGYSVHTYGTQHYEISVDGGEFEQITSYARTDVREEYSEHYPLSYDVNAYLHYIDASDLGVGEHTAVVRARTLGGSYCEVSYIDIEVCETAQDEDDSEQVPDETPDTGDDSEQVPDETPDTGDDSEQVPDETPDTGDDSEQVPDETPDAGDDSEQAPDQTPDTDEGEEAPDAPVTNSKDLNGDGAVNYYDVKLLLLYIIGFDVTVTGDADINGDGKITGRDVLSLIVYIELIYIQSQQ